MENIFPLVHLWWDNVSWMFLVGNGIWKQLPSTPLENGGYGTYVELENNIAL